MRELRVGLEGKRLVFPDGKAACLACGGEPAGVRRVWFEEVAGALPGTGDLARFNNLAAGARAIAERITFDAPLCRAHRAKARWLSVGCALCALAVVGMIALGIWLVGSPSGRRKETFLQKWGPILLGLLPAIPGYFLWQRKDRGGLTCEVRREGASGLVLCWPDSADGPGQRDDRPA